jgi:hypothetical protein
MATPDVRFTINAGNRTAAFLSVIETRTGELRLILRSGENRETEIHPGTKIATEKYSIHNSDQSPDYTTLHYSMICEDAWRAHAFQLTDAIKKNTGFAPLYVSATSDLSMPQYAFTQKRKTKLVNMGSYNPKSHTFCYGVIVGHRDASFAIKPPSFVNVLQSKFKRYNIILLWSFATLLSSPFCSMSHVFTIRPEHANTPDGEALLRSMMGGRTIETCVDYYLQARKILMEQQIEKVCRWLNAGDGWKETMISLTQFVFNVT